MAFPYAFCPEHGLVEFEFFPLPEGKTIHLNGFNTTCSVHGCGRTIPVISAGYKHIGKELNIIIDKSAPPETIKALLEIASLAVKGEISSQEAIEKAKEIDPKHGAAFSKFLGAHGLNAATLLVSLYACHASIEGNKSSTEIGLKTLEVLKQQDKTLSEISEKLDKFVVDDIQTSGAEPVELKAEPSRIAPKQKPKRRSEVKKMRRDELKRRRAAFTPRPKPKPKNP